MRPLLAMLCVAWLTVAVAAVPVPVPEQPSQPKQQAPQVSLGEAHTYARIIKQTLDIIARNYVKPVPEEKLAAAALQALAEAAGATLPSHLQPDPEKALRASDLDNEFVRVRQVLGNPPVIQGENAIRISIQGMMKVLDPPYSSYLGPDEVARNGFLSGESDGLGMTLEERTGPGPLVVRSVTLSGPAQQAGIRPNDLVHEIDGEPTAKWSAAEGMRRLSRSVGTRLALLVARPGTEESRRIELVAARVKEPVIAGVRRLDAGTWDFMMDRERKIGLVRVGPLTSRQYDGLEEPPDTRDELAKALEQLGDQGVKGLIVDLRECPGGSLQGAVNVASLFIGQGLIATAEYRDPGKQRTYNSNRPGTFLDVPMVALVGPDTSGGGELVAAALQDSGRARIAGQRSRGKASIQDQATNVGGVHYIRLSAGFFVRPSGRNLHRFADSKPTDDWGVRPEEELDVRISPALRRQVREWRLLHDLRPPDSRAVLPLDDPEKDPIVYSAWQDLLRRTK
jgi:carboxyl-terminal processing protease